MSHAMPEYVMAVVILKTGEYTRADRYDSEKVVKGDKIIEWIKISDNVLNVYILLGSLLRA